MKPLPYIFFLTLACMAPIAHAFELTSSKASNSAAKTTWQHKNSEIILYGPDNPDKPIVWQGPLEIKNKTGTNQYDVQLADRLYIIDDILFTLSYSGSNHYLDMIDLTNLSHRVKSRPISSGRLVIDKQFITIQPTCECVENDICHCNAAQVLSWNRKGITHNKAKSRKLTKKLLGTGFEGVKIIPKSSVQINN